MNRAALVALLVAPALAGCVGGARTCEPPFPLVLQAYAAVGDSARLEFQSTLWNCTDADIPLDEPCEGRLGLVPRVVIENETYYLDFWNNGTAQTADALQCDLRPPPRAVAEPGAYVQQRFRWDGTYQRAGEDAPREVAPGAYVVRVEAGPYVASQFVEVPW